MDVGGPQLVIGPHPSAAAQAVQRYAAAERRVEWGAVFAAAIALIGLVLFRTPMHGLALDVPVQRATNAMMNRWPGIDLQTAILNQDIFLLIIAAGALALWFRSPPQKHFRSRILISLFAFVAAYGIARVCQQLDHHVRPIVVQQLWPLGDPNFQTIRAQMTHGGSFPSDHAVLLAIVTFVAFLAGRRTGLVVLFLSAYSCLFRVGYGYCWPSDIFGGAFLGIVVVLVLFRWRRLLAPLLVRIFAFIDRRPGTAAAIGTVAVCEFGSGFRYSQFFVQLALHTRLFH